MEKFKKYNQLAGVIELSKISEVQSCFFMED